MPTIRMEVPHRLPQAEALARVKSLLGDMKMQFAGTISDLEEEWSGPTGKFRFSAMGFRVSGALTVNPASVSISVDLPLAASLMKGRIESVMRERLQALLA